MTIVIICSLPLHFVDEIFVSVVSAFIVHCHADENKLMMLQLTTGEGPSSDSGVESTGDGSRTGTPTSFANNYTGILTLVNQQRV
jgi:hypothetical protein